MAARRPKTRVGISTEDRSTKKRTGSTRRTKAPEKAASRGRKKPKKQNNSALFIGLGVGAFLLLIIIIAAANSGGGSSSGSGDRYMSVSQKKSIYAEYVRECKSLERETRVALDGMDADTKKRARSGLGKRLSNLKEAFKNRLQGRFEKKIRNLPKDYIAQKVIAYGKSNGW